LIVERAERAIVKAGAVKESFFSNMKAALEEWSTSTSLFCPETRRNFVSIVSAKSWTRRGEACTPGLPGFPAGKAFPLDSSFPCEDFPLDSSFPCEAPFPSLLCPTAASTCELRPCTIWARS
jgi:hypothetical protein